VNESTRFTAQQEVRETFQTLRTMSAPLATLFYGRLFAYAPGLRPMFRGDLTTQGAKSMSLIESCVDSLTSSQRKPASPPRAFTRRFA
jgi:nitric oxide dioxygenase